MLPRRALAALPLLASAAGAAAPIRLLSGGALEPAVHAALELWRAAGGAEVAVTFNTAPRIAERLAAGERPDLVLAPIPVIEGLARAATLAAPPLPLGSVGVGMAVRDGAARPAITDEASLRAEVLAADAVVFNRASTGLYMDRLFERLGLTAAVTPKAVRFPDGDAVLRRIAGGSGREIAFAAMTEITLFRDKGVHLLGPLPDALQNRTLYAAALLGGAEAAALLAFLGTERARAAMREAGIELPPA